MTSLPDVNVWIALAVGEHTHHRAARKWLDALEENIAFCRVTQMGLLRLLTNQQALGPDTFTPARAWATLDAFMNDSRISRIEEPASLDHHWRAFTMEHKHGSNWWTDSYLAAFAATARCTLVTFDAQLASHQNVNTLLLK